MRRQAGIALVQVLLITGIIGLLMLQMGLTAREQVARAKALDDRAALQLAAQSREAALVYSLLTEPLARVPYSKNPYAAAWNFEGRPFTVDDITFRIQDESGRLRVPDDTPREFEQLLLELGVTPTRARRLGQELMALQGIALPLQELGAEGQKAVSLVPGRFPLQEISQLRQLPDMDDALYRRVRPLLTLYPTPGFNPTTAAPQLLGAQLTASQAAGLEQARGAGNVDSLSLWKLTGVQADETTVVAPGPGLTVSLEMTLGEARTRRTTTFIVRPYSDDPLAVWQRVQGSDLGDEQASADREPDRKQE